MERRGRSHLRRGPGAGLGAGHARAPARDLLPPRRRRRDGGPASRVRRARAPDRRRGARAHRTHGGRRGGRRAGRPRPDRRPALTPELFGLRLNNSGVDRAPGSVIRMNYDGLVLEPGPFIQTLSGRRVNPLDAAVEDIDPSDIARALSNLCRFGGHSKAFYSVAQHSSIVCDLLEARGATPDELMAALLHDAAEAYLGDLPHPLKHRSELGTTFRVAEKRLEAVIGERFALPEAAARIKPLDKALLATERRIFSEVTWHWPELDGAEELDLEIEPWDSARALEEFTARYERIDALRRG